MLCIKNSNTDPYFNLAAEEYILKTFKDDCFMLWRSKPSIVVGKHQNALAEINYDFVKKNNIDVIRRLSGGGTVFHDLGNLNFTFIEDAKDQQNLVDFKRYISPIVNVLQNMGINAKHEGRNDIMVDGKKISGNAEHVFKKRVLHHGTLLFTSEIKSLSHALKVNPLIYSDKGVKSVRSRVANISEYLNESVDLENFKTRIYNYIIQNNKEALFYEFSDEDIKQIQQLAEEKYKTWEWNFGYSPKYIFEKSFMLNEKLWEIELHVEKGLIERAIVIIDNERSEKSVRISKILTGKFHREQDLLDSLLNNFNSRKTENTEIDKLINYLF